MSTTPNLRSSQYDKIYNNLPVELKREFDKFQNRNKCNDGFKVEDDEQSQFQERLDSEIVSISIYNMDWRNGLNRNKRESWLKLRGMCASCWMIFNGIHDKINSFTQGPEPYYTYTLKCAEWQAMTRFLNESHIKR